MQIKINRDLCIGAATCSAIAPDVFDLDDDMKAYVKDPKGADEETILDAAKSCPTLSLIIIDDAGKQVFPVPAS